MPGVVFRRKSGGNSSASCASSSLHAGGVATLRTEPQLIVRRLAFHSRSAEHLPRASEVGTDFSGNGGPNASGAYQTSASGAGRSSHYFATLFDGWSNWQIRCVLGAMMILGFSFLISCGHLVITLMTVVIQTAVFGEVINVAYLRYRERRLAWFRTLNW